MKYQTLLKMFFGVFLLSMFSIACVKEHTLSYSNEVGDGKKHAVRGCIVISTGELGTECQEGIGKCKEKACEVPSDSIQTFFTPAEIENIEQVDLSTKPELMEHLEEIGWLDK